ncbi:MAG: hypothetical protein ACM31E_01575 [Fibrobacterota bacterium]
MLRSSFRDKAGNKGKMSGTWVKVQHKLLKYTGTMDRSQHEKLTASVL